MEEQPPVTEQPTQGRARRLAFAEQELRLISSLVLLIGLGLFFALPFVLSIGSVVFLPVVTALVLTVILSPLADKLNGWGLPNALASLVSLVVFFAILLLSGALILQPAVALYDDLPAMVQQVMARFGEVQQRFAWVAQINDQLAMLMNREGEREVVLATPSLLEELAFATPSFVIETVLTLLMTYFMVEARVRLRQRLLFGRTSFGTSIKAARVLREVQDRVASYILTVGWINAMVGVVVALGAWAMGLGAPIMWGGLAALLNFLPYVGPIVMLALLSLFGIGTADTIFLGILPALAYLALHTIEANFVTPSILGARFTMNPVLILIALSYFSWIWGVFGALLSVPILLMLTALFDHIGRPNLVGFIFGEPLFANDLLVEAEGEPDA
ncbi:AI-2E family transporter [Erythrobacter mangrovi]|uniref:AI-2E family transporter n=1 Tax=Erythrobacter mangrovi TaxID=2739433 RepID=A0A7D3XNM5_9SPHN|nr:AI-2E family transporter [Erythrobacter mangrovi]QKG70434.1 AI-2E family transporter [Erythrobacter mangrovi]